MAPEAIPSTMESATRSDRLLIGTRFKDSGTIGPKLASFGILYTIRDGRQAKAR